MLKCSERSQLAVASSCLLAKQFHLYQCLFALGRELALLLRLQQSKVRHVIRLLANHIAGTMATIVAQIEGLISLGRRSKFLLRATIGHIVTTRERDVSLEILLRSLRCRWYHHGQGCQQK